MKVIDTLTLLNPIEPSGDGSKFRERVAQGIVIPQGDYERKFYDGSPRKPTISYHPDVVLYRANLPSITRARYQMQKGVIEEDDTTHSPHMKRLLRIDRVRAKAVRHQLGNTIQECAISEL